MPANSTHLDYDANLPAWLRARDVIAGDESVKSGGEKYLSRLDSQTDDEYFDYDVSVPPPQGRWRIYGIFLPDEVLEKVYHANAEKILGLA